MKTEKSIELKRIAHYAFHQERPGFIAWKPKKKEKPGWFNKFQPYIPFAKMILYIVIIGIIVVLYVNYLNLG